MTRRTLRNAVAACLFLPLSLLAACGSPSGYDICNINCEYLKKCVGQTDTQLANCHTACENTKGTLTDADAALARDCKNAGDIRRAQADCYTLACLETPGCLLKNTNISLCQK